MFDIQQSIYDENGDVNSERLEDFVDGLLDNFAQSPEGKAHLKGENDPGWADMFLRYYFDYIGGTVSEMSWHDVEEVIFTLLPRKVAVEPECASEIIEELCVFWTYLGRQFDLRLAPTVVTRLDDKAVLKLHNALASPRNFGMAKSFVMMGQAAGFDMSTEDGLAAFMAAYNSQLGAGSEASLGGGVPLPQSGWLGGGSFLELPGTGKSRKERRKKKKQERQAKRRNRR